MTPPRISYDVFLSHNRADKPWVRSLATRLAATEYNGRRLRPWLDEHFLDPGDLSGEAELTTAMDRSRILALVLSPEALASTWVDFELRYFTEQRGRDRVVAILLRDCNVPEALHGLEVLDFRGVTEGDASFAELLARLCPPPLVTVAEAERAVDEAFSAAVEADSGGFAPGPTPERDGLLEALVRHEIDDAGTEGPVVAGFLRAAERLRGLYDSRHPAAYNLKMLLGECLAAALVRSPGYRQVAQRYVDRAGEEGDEPILLFVVARAYSKLAELDPRRVDHSVLFRLLERLDGAEAGNEARAIEALCARVLAKMRDDPGAELLIKALGERGRASRIAAAGAISIAGEQSAPVFYLSELSRTHPSVGEAGRAGPPSRKLLGELFALDLGQDAAVTHAVRLARAELAETYPGIDFPYGLSWFLRKEAVTEAHRAPFAGTILKVTTASMVEMAERVEVTTVACLTERRVVDALFDGCGALLIPTQEPDSPQCRRLTERAIPFAMVEESTFGGLSDGDRIVAEGGTLRILKR